MSIVDLRLSSFAALGWLAQVGFVRVLGWEAAYGWTLALGWEAALIGSSTAEEAPID